MYNKIINAIDVLSRVEGEEVVFNLDHAEDTEIYKYSYTIGSIEVYKYGSVGALQIRVKDVDVKADLEDDHLNTIYNKVKGIYDKRLKEINKAKKDLVKEYLNSFVGK